MRKKTMREMKIPPFLRFEIGTTGFNMKGICWRSLTFLLNTKKGSIYVCVCEPCFGSTL